MIKCLFRGNASLVLLVLLGISSFVSVNGYTEEAVKSCEVNKPYCGVSCVYLSAKLAGLPVGFQDVFKQEYIGSEKGSSLLELIKVSKMLGLKVAPVTNLTADVLRRCKSPVILHVKSSPEAKDYDHYVLYLGTQDGMARIYYPPDHMELISFRKFIPQWDGTGLIVSNKTVRVGTLFRPVKIKLGLYTAMMIVVILLMHSIKKFMSWTLTNTRAKRLILSPVQGVTIAVAGVVIGFMCQLLSSTGLLANPSEITAIQRAFQAEFIPKVDVATVEGLIGSDLVFVDARFERDFESAHLVGAINIPVSSSDEQMNQIAAEIAKNSRIIVYCQSKGCDFAKEVAGRLVNQGFSNISIFKGGWNEWVAHKKDKHGDENHGGDENKGERS